MAETTAAAKVCKTGERMAAKLVQSLEIALVEMMVELSVHFSAEQWVAEMVATKAVLRVSELAGSKALYWVVCLAASMVEPTDNNLVALLDGRRDLTSAYMMAADLAVLMVSRLVA